MIDVLVIGAGPTGLMMAIELCRQGLTCRIIDLAKEPSKQSKALAIQPRTLEIFYHIGLIEECLSLGVKIKKFIPHSHHEKLAEVSFDLIDSPFPFILSLEQSCLERILTDHLQKLGVTIEREVELISFEQNSQHVHARLHHLRTEEKEQVSASWLLGCDGAHSTVRKTLNLSFEGRPFPDIFSLADLEIEWKYSHNNANAFIDEKGLFAAFPLKNKNRYRLIFQLQRCKDLLKQTPLHHGELSPLVIPPPTLEEASELVHRYADKQAILKNPVWMTHFHVHSRMVSQYRDRRVFLLGDAAHIHSPVGGQGMNTGLQDAFNLGWKLKLAEDSLLDSYSSERHYVESIYSKQQKRLLIFFSYARIFWQAGEMPFFVLSFHLEDCVIW